MAAIQTEKLTRRYGDVVAVQNLDLTVENGEIYGFLGPNGAGKTTTINMLLSLVRPSSGSAQVFGHDATENIREIHGRIGVLPAHTDLYDRLTARKHLEFAIDVKDASDDPESLLARVGLADAVDRQAGDFSTGMAQRLKLAMALIDDPDLLILDEPTNGLDPNGAREIRQIVQEENDRGATVFFSSHIMEQVESVCDRVGILHEGELVAEDTIDALQTSVAAGIELSVTVDGRTNGLPDRLRALEAVSTVRVTDRTIHTSITDADGKGQVMTEIAETGMRILDFELQENDLEDVFARYTDAAPADGPTEDRPVDGSASEQTGAVL
jgi:ABC-2 type transport system ATP-binding protein